MRERKFLVVNGTEMTVDGPAVALAIGIHGQGGDRILGLVDFGNQQIFLLISAVKIELQEII